MNTEHTSSAPIKKKKLLVSFLDSDHKERFFNLVEANTDGAGDLTLMYGFSSNPALYNAKDPYVVPEQGNRAVAYADKKQLERAIMEKYPPSQEQIQREAEEEQRRAERIGKSSKTNAMMNKPHTGSAGKRKQNHRKQVSFSEAYDLVQKGGMG